MEDWISFAEFPLPRLKTDSIAKTHRKEGD